MERCICGHPISGHIAIRVGNHWEAACKAVPCECREPEAVDAADLAATDVGATEARTNEEADSVGATLLYAWDAALCTSCDWRTSAPEILARPAARCLRCNAALAPVRLEMHSREVL